MHRKCMYSRRMGPGGVPHRALHLLPLARAQKERARERDVQLAQQVPWPRARSPLFAPDDVHARAGGHPAPRDVHRAHDDAPERPAQRERDVDVCGPLPVDVRRAARAALVLRWVVGWDGGGEV